MAPVEIEAELSAAMGHTISLQPLEGGLDSAARNYRSGDYFIKVRRDVPPGASLTSALAIPGVLAPLRVVHLANGSHALVYQYIDAKNGFDHPLSRDNWEQVGRILRQVHDFKDPTPWLAKETFEVPGTDTLESSPLAHLVEANRAQVDWLIAETEQLGHRLSKQSWTFVPCHADLHVGNILTADNKVWLVDWDTARTSPRECDLLFFLGTGILGLHGQQEEAAFLRGYGEVEFSPDLIRYFQLARVLEDVVSFAAEGDEAWFSRQFASGSLLCKIQGT